MKQPIEIKLPWPARALHSNARCHWSEKARAASKARKEAWALALEAKLPCWPQASILIEYWPAHRRFDVHNVASSLKASIDGIADAMGVDDRAFKVDYPRVFAGTTKSGEVVFRIYQK